MIKHFADNKTDSTYYIVCAFLIPVSKAIEQVAGKGLTEELAKLNGCQVGEAKTTAGTCSYVYTIHTE